MCRPHKTSLTETALRDMARAGIELVAAASNKPEASGFNMLYINELFSCRVMRVLDAPLCKALRCN